MMITPQCFECKHFHENRADRTKPYTCDAFPSGIPDPVLLNDHDHHKPYPGDHGIRFEPSAGSTPPS